MIIWSSINSPTVICSSTVCYFSREKRLAKPTAPGSLSHIFAFAIYFSFAFIFRSIKPEIQKYLAAIYSYLFYLAFDLSTYYKFISRPFAYLRRRIPEGIDIPFYTSGCEHLLFVCRGCLRCVAWFSYWFDNLGSYLREIPIAIVLHHPFLFGEIPTWLQAASKGISGAVARRIFNIY